MLERHAASQFKAQANVSKRFDCCWGSPVYHFYLGVCSLPMVNYSSMRWLIPRFCIYLLVPNSNACWVPISRSGTSRMQSTHNWNGILEPETLKLQLSGWKVALQSWMICSFFLGFSWPLYLLYQVSVSITLSHSLKLFLPARLDPQTLTWLEGLVAHRVSLQRT